MDFKGVKVGTVTDIKIVLNKKDLSLADSGLYRNRSEENRYAGSESDMMKIIEPKLKGEKKFIELLIENGLRAQLEMQSLVTGQLGIHLDFFPDTASEAGRRGTRVP